MAGELLAFPNEVFGLALNLEEDQIGAVLMGETRLVQEGDEVRRTGRIIQVPVGEALVGRVVDALGRPVDGKGPIKAVGLLPARARRAGRRRAAAREGAAADRHQGDRRHDPDRPRPARAHHRRPPDRQDRGRDRHHHQPEGRAASSASTSPSARSTRPWPRWSRRSRTTARWSTRSWSRPRPRIRRRCSTSPPTPAAPWASTSCDHGKHALVIYDDLSKQAAAYREISLLLRRPPGREAYPGDVFYLHSRLLERAAKLSDALGGGSLTALPIIETQAGDVSAYIPTNVISITDGQIFLEADLFYAGVRPAINVGISVSRVGGNAQIKAMKQDRRHPAARPRAVPRARRLRAVRLATSTRRRRPSSPAASAWSRS